MTVTTVTPSQPVHGRDTEIRFALASDVSISTDSTLAAVFSTSTVISAAAKNISITPPETAWELVNFLGNNSNNFQNAVLDEKPVGAPTISGTLVVYTEDDYLEGFLDNSGTTVASTYNRYQIGNNESPEVAILVTLNNGTRTANICFDDARITKWGDVKISGADSHWEQDFSAICLPEDFYWEYQQS